MIRGLEEALEQRGYTCLFAIGFGTRADGSYSVKIAACPEVRSLELETWRVMRHTIIGALDRLMSLPLDDLEIEV